MRSMEKDDVSAERVVGGWRWSCRGMAKDNSSVFFSAQAEAGSALNPEALKNEV